MKKLVLYSFLLTFLPYLFSSVPSILNYAGQVSVDGQAFTGNGQFKFALVDGDGNVTYWSNDGTSVNGSEPSAFVTVSVNGGLYSVLLGNSAINGMDPITPTIFQQHLDTKLRIWFNDGAHGFQLLAPDQPFASVPYAMSAGSAFLGDGSVSSSKMDPNLIRYFIPEISTNPSSISLLQGESATLSVQSNGKFLSYQWQRNGENLIGETNASLVLTDANASLDDVNYSVVISNDWGDVISQVANVSVATALPTITLNGEATIAHEAATVYTDAGASALDALGNDLTSAISITSVDINITSVSEQAVTYSVTDAGGNVNTATRTVMVQDTTVPSLFLRGDSNYTHNLNTAWADPGYDANDTLDGNLTNSVSISGTVDVNTTGTYTLNYSVSDTAGNQVDVNRTVNVAEIPQGPWTFTNAGATGRLGPTQVQIDANYLGTSLEGAVTIDSTYQGIQEWIVPQNGTYMINASGAMGGGSENGRGAKIIGNINLSKGQKIKVLVGQSPLSGRGGGGGTFITGADNSPLIVAAGGGGSDVVSTGTQNGSTETVGNHGTEGDGDYSGDYAGKGGIGGGGGGAGGASDKGNGGNGGNASDGQDTQGDSSNCGGGGGGFIGNGGDSSGSVTGGDSFVNGGMGGLGSSEGGFGGGGGGGGAAGSGGGGGFSGGGGGGWRGSWHSNVGGGGGSYNSGTNQDNQSGVHEGLGNVTITFIGN